MSGAIALAVSPIEPAHLLLATDSGLLRSRNAGRDWSLEAPSLLVGAVFAVAFDADGRRALASTGSALFRRTTPGPGRPSPRPQDTLPARLLVPDRAGRVYLVGWQRLCVSDDWGTSWNAVAAPLPETPVTRLLVARGAATVYAIAGERLWALDEGTRTWRPSDAGLPQGRIDTVAADAGEPRRLWATARGQVFRSDDARSELDAVGTPHRRAERGGARGRALAQRRARPC